VAEVEHPRSIRSFVTRGGRITEAQQRALEGLWPRYGIEFQATPLDFSATFGRQASVTVEIGFGNGENLATLAAHQPERDYLGIEVHRPGVGRLLLALQQQRLSNVRVICHDAVEVLAQQIALQSLDEMLILFPDPWPKKRHHKRRLIQPPFVELVAARLRPGGVLRFATDWQPYANAALEVFSGSPQLHNLSPDGTFVPRPPGRQPTRFEKRGERLGHAVWDMCFAKAE
jgi:tRNA (guanine-N7-)-methyltransferase